jgi:hypothetical protein
MGLSGYASPIYFFIEAAQLTARKGLDGSLKTLHCEAGIPSPYSRTLLMGYQEEYRGRGLAKAVTLRLFREGTADFGQDGFSHADVAVENLQSQGVCKSLKGTVRWRNYCMLHRAADLQRGN